jgi:hypothetical protein
MKNLKTLNIFYLVSYWKQKVHNDFIFYVVSDAFHTGVPAFRKCVETSRKKLFWLKAQPLLHKVEEILLEN